MSYEIPIMATETWWMKLFLFLYVFFPFLCNFFGSRTLNRSQKGWMVAFVLQGGTESRACLTGNMYLKIIIIIIMTLYFVSDVRGTKRKTTHV